MDGIAEVAMTGSRRKLLACAKQVQRMLCRCQSYLEPRKDQNQERLLPRRFLLHKPKHKEELQCEGE